MLYLSFLRVAVHDEDHIIMIWPDTKKPKNNNYSYIPSVFVVNCDNSCTCVMGCNFSSKINLILYNSFITPISAKLHFMFKLSGQYSLIFIYNGRQVLLLGLCLKLSQIPIWIKISVFCPRDRPVECLKYLQWSLIFLLHSFFCLFGKKHLYKSPPQYCMQYIVILVEYFVTLKTNWIA